MGPVTGQALRGLCWGPEAGGQAAQPLGRALDAPSWRGPPYAAQL